MINNTNFENAGSLSCVNKNTHNIRNKVSKLNNQFDSLTKFLKENGISNKDIDSFEEIIEVKGKINLEKGYGKEVKEWITTMVSKSM